MHWDWLRHPSGHPMLGWMPQYSLSSSGCQKHSATKPSNGLSAPAHGFASMGSHKTEQNPCVVSCWPSLKDSTHTPDMHSACSSQGSYMSGNSGSTPPVLPVEPPVDPPVELVEPVALDESVPVEPGSVVPLVETTPPVEPLSVALVALVVLEESVTVPEVPLEVPSSVSSPVPLSELSLLGEAEKHAPVSSAASMMVTLVFIASSAFTKNPTPEGAGFSLVMLSRSRPCGVTSKAVRESRRDISTCLRSP